MGILKIHRGQIVLDRRIIPACDGLLALAQTFRGSDTRTVVTHGAFVLARIEVLEGSLSFPLNLGDVPAPKRFLLILPPQCVLPMAFHNAYINSEGVAGFSPLITNGPALLAYHNDGSLFNLKAVERAVNAPVLQQLDPDIGVAPAIVRARRLLHELIAHPAPVSGAAKRIGICSETLSRGFYRAYRLLPKQYCHRARLFEAVLRLLSGATILEAALAAGFWDLKRFYTQFKRLLGTTPGVYTQVKKRQDIALDNRL
ncbi:MAG: AraC family transcriptional regulator [Acidobacteriota bacterium]